MSEHISKSSYYDYRRIDAHNAQWNFILGGRGIGKTFGGIRKGINDFIRRGNEFMYVRRYDEEIRTSKATFFDAVAPFFPDWEFRVNGMVGEIAPAEPEHFQELSRKDQKEWLKDREWKTVVHFAALSTSQKLKSKAFPSVTRIFYDEIILEKGFTRYIPMEARAMLNLYETVDRKRDKVKVYFLANAVSIDNPYFITYDISPDDVQKEFVLKADGFIACHFPDSEAFKAEAAKTRFGKFVKDFNPEYYDYAFENTFSDNDKTLIEEMDPRAGYMFTLETAKGSFAVHNRLGSRVFYMRSKRPKADESMFTMIPARATKDRLFVEPRDTMLTYLRTAWRQGNAYFDKPATRNAFLEIFQK